MYLPLLLVSRLGLVYSPVFTLESRPLSSHLSCAVLSLVACCTLANRFFRLSALLCRREREREGEGERGDEEELSPIAPAAPLMIKSAIIDWIVLSLRCESSVFTFSLPRCASVGIC